MRLFLQVEISARDLEARLYLALLAAEKGHHSVVGNLASISRLALSKSFPPGVFHLKSLTPSTSRIEQMKRIRAAGHAITSMDEEAGLVDFDFMLASRYSAESLSLADAVFCWGEQERTHLASLYPEQALKLHTTGSPRLDLLARKRTAFGRDFIPRTKYVLISSNLAIAPLRDFTQIYQGHVRAGYFQRDTELEESLFGRQAEDWQMAWEYIAATRALAEEFPNFTFIFRPHPVDNELAWRNFFSSHQNIVVTKIGSIADWLPGASAVVQNGCTTSIEATVANTPVLTFIPFDQKFSHDLANALGHRVTSRQELISSIRELFSSDAQAGTFEAIRARNINLLADKIKVNSPPSAADEILEIIERVAPDHGNQRIPIRSARRLFVIERQKARLLEVKRVLTARLSNTPFVKKSSKLEEFSEEEIRIKIGELQGILGRPVSHRLFHLGPKVLIIAPGLK